MESKVVPGTSKLGLEETRAQRWGDDEEDTMSLLDMIRTIRRPTTCKRPAKHHGVEKSKQNMLVTVKEESDVRVDPGPKFQGVVGDDFSSVKPEECDDGLQFSGRKRKHKDLKEILEYEQPIIFMKGRNAEAKRVKKSENSSKKDHDKTVATNTRSIKSRVESLPLQDVIKGSDSVDNYDGRHSGLTSVRETSQMDEMRHILSCFSELEEKSGPLPVTERKMEGAVPEGAGRSITEVRNSEQKMEIPIEGGKKKASCDDQMSQEGIAQISNEEATDFVPISRSGLHTCDNAKNCQNACVAKALVPHLDHMSDEELIYWYKEVTGTEFVSRTREKVRGRIRRVIRAEVKNAVLNRNSPGSCHISGTPASPVKLNLVIDLCLDSPTGKGATFTVGKKSNTCLASVAASSEKSADWSPDLGGVEDEFVDCRLNADKGSLAQRLEQPPKGSEAASGGDLQKNGLSDVLASEVSSTLENVAGSSTIKSADVARPAFLSPEFADTDAHPKENGTLIPPAERIVDGNSGTQVGGLNSREAEEETSSFQEDADRSPGVPNSVRARYSHIARNHKHSSSLHREDSTVTEAMRLSSTEDMGVIKCQSVGSCQRLPREQASGDSTVKSDQATGCSIFNRCEEITAGDCLKRLKDSKLVAVSNRFVQLPDLSVNQLDLLNEIAEMRDVEIPDGDKSRTGVYLNELDRAAAKAEVCLSVNADGQLGIGDQFQQSVSSQESKDRCHVVAPEDHIIDDIHGYLNIAQRRKSADNPGFATSQSSTGTSGQSTLSCHSSLAGDDAENRILSLEEYIAVHRFEGEFPEEDLPNRRGDISWLPVEGEHSLHDLVKHGSSREESSAKQIVEDVKTQGTHEEVPLQPVRGFDDEPHVEEESIALGTVENIVKQFEQVAAEQMEEDAAWETIEDGSAENSSPTISRERREGFLQEVEKTVPLQQLEEPVASQNVDEVISMQQILDIARVAGAAACAQLMVDDTTSQQSQEDVALQQTRQCATDNEVHFELRPVAEEVSVQKLEQAQQMGEYAVLEPPKEGSSAKQIATSSEPLLATAYDENLLEDLFPLRMQYGTAPQQESSGCAFGSPGENQNASASQLPKGPGLSLPPSTEFTELHGTPFVDEMPDVSKESNLSMKLSVADAEHQGQLARTTIGGSEEEWARENLNRVEGTSQAEATLSRLTSKASTSQACEDIRVSNLLQPNSAPRVYECVSNLEIVGCELHTDEKTWVDAYATKQSPTKTTFPLTELECQQLDDFSLTDHEWDQIGDFNSFVPRDEAKSSSSLPQVDGSDSCPRKRKACDFESESDPVKCRRKEQGVLTESAQGTSSLNVQATSIQIYTGETRSPMNLTECRSDAIDSTSSLSDQVMLHVRDQQSTDRFESLRARERRKESLHAHQLTSSHKSKLSFSDHTGTPDFLTDSLRAPEDYGEPTPNAMFDPLTAGENTCMELSPCLRVVEEQSSQEYDQPSKLPSRRKTISPSSQLELMRASSNNSPSSSESPPQKVPPLRLKLPAGCARHHAGVSQLDYKASSGCTSVGAEKVVGKPVAQNANVISWDFSDDDTGDSRGRKEHRPVFSHEEPVQKLSLAFSPISPSPQSLSDLDQNTSRQGDCVTQLVRSQSSKGILKKSIPEPCIGLCKCAECKSSRSKAGTASDFIASQMKNFQLIAARLTKEMQVLRTIIEANVSGEGEADKIQMTMKKSREVEETADKNLALLLRDCKRYCKLTAKLGPRKIVFADEAGKKLCHIKTFQSQVFTGPQTIPKL